MHISEVPVAYRESVRGNYTFPMEIMVWADGRIVWSDVARESPRDLAFFDEFERTHYFGPYFEANVGADRVAALLESLEPELEKHEDLSGGDLQIPFGGSHHYMLLDVGESTIRFTSAKDISMERYSQREDADRYVYSPERDGTVIRLPEGQSYEEWLEEQDEDFRNFHLTWDAMRDGLFSLIPDEDSDIEIKELGMIRFHTVRERAE